MSFNQSIQMLTFIWNEKRFFESKSARNAARRSVYRAATISLKSHLKTLENQNDEIRHEINRCYSDLQKYDEKIQILDNMTQLATHSLEVYFQARMENLRTFVTEQCRIIADGIQEEAEHWKEIHAMLQQKLVVPGDLRSYGGGNGLPRTIKQSPNFSRIVEETEEQEEDEEEEAEKTTENVTTLLQSRTLTPLLTQTLKKARLLASKLSQDTSMVIPAAEINNSTVVENNLTLRDVSLIEKPTQIEHDMPNNEVSVSFLPCIPTVPIDEDKQENKSTLSTISDKTFVKLSINKQFSSDEESDDDDDNDDDDDTIMEESYSMNTTRPLLLTADRSIRRPIQSLHKIIEEEKINIQEPSSSADNNHLEKTLNENKTNIILPTCIETNENEQKDVIESEISKSIQNENENENERPKVTELDMPKSQTIEHEPVPLPVENSTKRRTTRRTTIRLLREVQNDETSSHVPVEIPTKTRYATRYSTRLAASTIAEDITTSRMSTVRRRTTRLTSE